MSAYTVSRLAQDAGVSVHVVRDYLLRGLLRPAARTAGGYGVFDADALQRLCFVRAAFEAGVGLDVLTRLCRALDAPDTSEAAVWLAVLTCPCHLPILAVVLAGTSAGAFLGKYWVLAALGLAGLFLLSMARALRAFRERSASPASDANTSG